MSDLRTRIVAALKARDEAATAGVHDPFLVEHASYDDLAEAVIKELDMRIERDVSQWRNGDGELICISRYVTDWEADDDR